MHGAGSKRLIRDINEASVLDAVRAHGTVARADIARLLGLSPATVTGITARLVEAGMISEVSLGPSTGGRPPKILALNPDGGNVVGAAVTDDRVVAVTVNLVGDVVDRYAATWSGRSPRHAQDAVVAAAATLRERSLSRVLGVGLTLSGVVDHHTGEVRHSGQLGWENVPLGPAVGGRLDLPVTVDGRVNSLAAALVLFGEGHGVDDVVVVSIEHSIGLAIVLDGRVRRGASGASGSLAHTQVSVVDDDPRQCHCGARGCLEAVASVWAIRTQLDALGEPDPDAAAARAHLDPDVQRVFTGAGHALGGAVANVAEVINPQRVILGGEGTRLGPPLLDPFRDALRRDLARPVDQVLDLRVVHTEDDTWARGAACQLLADLFRAPTAYPG